MGLNNTQEFVIALLGALGAREVIAYIVKRWRYRTEISAQAGKIRAETKSLEVAVLSGLVERLDAKVIFLETELEKSRDREEECLRRGRELEREVQILKFKSAK